jgi:hypothetical protein
MDAEELLRADDGGVARVERKHNVAVAVGSSKCHFPLDLHSSHLSRTPGQTLSSAGSAVGDMGHEGIVTLCSVCLWSSVVLRHGVGVMHRHRSRSAGPAVAPRHGRGIRRANRVPPRQAVRDRAAEGRDSDEVWPRCKCSAYELRTRCRWRRPKTRMLSRHSRRMDPTHRSANAFALGARTGVFTPVSPYVRNTSSN